jgi:hypothetical protein
MMKVSTYEQQATWQPVNPDPNAFGAGVAQANQQLGNTIQNVAQLIDTRRLQQQQEKDLNQVLDTVTQMNKEIDNVLHNPDVDKDNKPIGILNRTLGNAEGATVDFDTQIEAIRQKYAGTLKGENQQNQFNKLYQGSYSSARSQVISFEAAQGRDADDQSTNDYLEQKKNDVAKNPLALPDAIASGNAIISVKGKQKGYKSESITVSQQKYVGNITIAAVKTLLDQGNNQTAKTLFDQVKDGIDEATATKIDGAINNAIQTDAFDNTATGLVEEYGEDLTKGHDEINQRTDLDLGQKQTLTETYDRKFAVMEQERRANENLQIDQGFQQISKAGNLTGAMNYINKMPASTVDDYKTKSSLTAIADQMYGVREMKTDPAAWYDLYDKIQAGKIANKQEMLKEYGGRISFSDMKTFWKAMDSEGTVGTSPYNKFSLATDGASLLKKNNITDSQQQSQYWDYVASKMGDFQLEKKRPPSSEEKDQILQDALVKTIVGKWQWGPFGGDKTQDRFQVPPNAQWSKSLNAWIYTDENGQLMKYNP